MSECAIFDIDGTLADLTHRLHHVSLGRKDWRAFFAAMEADTAIGPVARLARIVARELPVLCVSGRPEEHRAVTEQWLATECDLTPAWLYMRPTGDFRPDNIIKMEILAELRNDGWEPLFVVDDRPRVVEAWRSAGLTCLQCAWHEVEAPKAPVPEGTVLLSLLVGPSGAGKSTHAAATFPPRQVVSSDDVREDMLGDRACQEHNARVFEAVHALARTRLLAGMPAVVDATNIRRKDRLACVDLAPPGTLVRYIVIDRPVAAKLETRGWRPEALIHKHDQTFRSQVRDIIAGDGRENVIVEDRRQA